jgi:hypothetical protein
MATSPCRRKGSKFLCEGMVAVLDDYVSLTTVKDGKRKVENGAQDKGWRAEMAAFAGHQEGKEPPIPYEQIIGCHQVHVCGGGVDTK